MSNTKMNTIFSYFNKTPKSKKTNSNGDNDKRSLSNNNNTISAEKVKVHAGDLVWAKLEGYPWWPSLVCVHPTHKVHSRKEGKSRVIHVQFFDDPPTRGWVKEKFVNPFSGSDVKEFQRGGTYFTSDPRCRQGATAADAALATSVEERLRLVVDIESTDDDEEEEEPSMEVDEFNAEIFDAEFDSGKENQDEDAKPLTSDATSDPAVSSRSSSRPTKKRRRTVIESDSGGEDSDDEFKPQRAKRPGSEDEDVGDVEEDDDDDDSGEEEGETESEASGPESSPVKGVKRKRPSVSTPKPASRSHAATTPKSAAKPSKSAASPATPSTPRSQPGGATGSPFTPSVGSKTKSKLEMFSASQEVAPVVTEQGRSFPHLHLDFLKPDKIRDAERRSRTDPLYNPRTLCLPDTFLAKQTPAMRQWWVMKAKHFDTVLFFKMGKFYELFHMDAVISVNELGIVFMKGDYAHCGFPEVSFGRYSETLLQRGYRVARIEQTETPDMMADRCKTMGRPPTKFDRVVNREVCNVQTKATRRQSFIDGATGDCAGSYLLAVREKCDNEVGSCSTFGVCFVDTTIGRFWIGQFVDDRHASRLRTLFCSYPPAQVLYERGKLSQRTQALLGTYLVSAIKDALRPGVEFWDAAKTLAFLADADYFQEEPAGGATDAAGSFRWPETLDKMIDNCESMGRTYMEGYDLALSALGAIVWYLKESFIEQELLSMRRFDEFRPLDLVMAAEVPSPDDARRDAFPSSRQQMVLDAVTLSNLELVENSTTGGQEGALLDTLDRCSTPFGRRLFKQWLCAPLCDPVAIDDRLDAADDLGSVPEVVAEVTELLRKMPDLERLISKIHTLGSASRAQNHPDSRAIFFEDLIYSKRKIEDFLSALAGWKTAMAIIGKFKGSSAQFKSRLLRRCVSLKPDGTTGDGGCEDGSFPDLSQLLDFFDNAFDREKARSAGVIVPSKGVDAEYDAAVTETRMIKRELDEYLDSQRALLGCKTVVYWGSGRNRFQMELPDSAAKRAPANYELTSQRRGFRRYRTAVIERHLTRLTRTEEKRDAALRDIMRRIFNTFDKSAPVWQAAVRCLSVLDALMSLAAFRQADGGDTCRPQFVLAADCELKQPFLEIRNGRHPCIVHTFSGSEFVPNDTVIGIADAAAGQTDASAAQLVLVTGANMGGKSTLMRQVGIIVIMAQMGCYVPAESCRLSPVDRVFIRLGASDRIMSGESTFFVELSETSAILQHASQHSLVLLDELGRGTATHDGTAIAFAVANELSRNTHCRTLFSTHYHSLVEDFSRDANVRLGHMACMVENEDDDDPSGETITFLYKFVSGACPKSYGFNAARLADIPSDVIRLAHAKAKQLEDTTKCHRLFRAIHHLQDVDKIRRLIASI